METTLGFQDDVWAWQKLRAGLASCAVLKVKLISSDPSAQFATIPGLLWYIIYFPRSSLEVVGRPAKDSCP